MIRKKCLICGDLIMKSYSWASIFSQRLICQSCNNKFMEVKDGCIKCGKVDVIGMCNDCIYWQNNPLTQKIDLENISLYYYNNFMKEVLTRIKFRGDYEILKNFKGIINNKIKEIERVEKKKALLVPVPISKERRLERGFNQSEEIARLINRDVFNELFKNNTRKQSKKGRNERRILNNSIFMLKNGISVNNKVVVIIDDIYTTGSTVYQVAKSIKKIYHDKIYVLTLARAM